MRTVPDSVQATSFLICFSRGKSVPLNSHVEARGLVSWSLSIGGENDIAYESTKKICHLPIVVYGSRCLC
jgi:hypothetical protein